MGRDVAVAAATALALACGGGGDLAGPPEISWGEVECAHCRMIVSDPHYAAASVSSTAAAVFDDVGCLVAARRAETATGRAWVSGHGGGGWIEASDAWYVVGTDRVTPMGSGILAFATPEGAAAASERHGGRSVRWPDLQDTTVQANQ